VERSAEGTAAGESFRDTKRWFRKHPELGPAGISTDAFWSQEQFDLERERLWPHVWLMVGRAEEIPAIGDFLVKDIPSNSVSLLVVRGRDGTIRAFHNVCPHRGTQLCWGKHGSVAAFTCPYHGFTFNLEGRLTFVPDEANFYDLDKSLLGLTSVVTDTWEGFIFVHLDPNPKETLREFIGDEVAQSVADFPFHERTRFHEYKAILNCNWKVLISGFLEAFHARSLHARSVNRISSKENPFAHTEFIKLFDKHRILSFYSNPNVLPTPLGKIAYARQDKSTKKDKPEGSGSAEDVVSIFRSINKAFLVHNMFPNFQLNTVRGEWFQHQFWPLSRNQVLWEVRLYYSKPRNASQVFFQDYSRYTSRDNLMEDVYASERSQLGLDAGLVKRWVLQDEEIAIQHFNKVVADYTHSQGDRIAAE
jgi:phenylpropionate dioxygenase-like ring-hydroxylating dioxygenase large terminal subunit